MQKNLFIEINSKNVEDKYDVIKFVGELDKVGHSDIKSELEEFVKSFSKKILIFDFSGLKFINSEGIGYLMEIHTFLMKGDKKLVIIGANSHVKDVFNTIGIQEIISTYSNLKEFKSS